MHFSSVRVMFFAVLPMDFRLIAFNGVHTPSALIINWGEDFLGRDLTRRTFVRRGSQCR